MTSTPPACARKRCKSIEARRIANAPVFVINPNTIAKAVRELEGEGVTVSRPGAGTFVSERRPTMSREERRRRLQEGFEGVLTEAVPWGATDEETRKAFEDAMARLRGRRGGGA